MGTDIDMNWKKIKTLGYPSLDSDAANVNYVKDYVAS